GEREGRDLVLADELESTALRRHVVAELLELQAPKAASAQPDSCREDVGFDCDLSTIGGCDLDGSGFGSSRRGWRRLLVCGGWLGGFGRGGGGAGGGAGC